MFSDELLRAVAISLGFSERESDIVRLMMNGVANEKVIARLLGISRNAVNSHFQRLYQKLDVQDHGELYHFVFAEYLEHTTRQGVGNLPTRQPGESC
jgi:DNA-binding NarL/FixJ family response regulator